MGRLSLTCECGWSFFVADSIDQATVNCPSCAQPVPIPGFIEGDVRLTPGELATRRMRQQDLMKNIFITAGILGLIAVGFVMVRKNEEEPATPPPPPPPPASVAVAPPPPAPPEPPPDDGRIDEAEFEVMRTRAAALRNKAMLVPRMDVVVLKGEAPIEATVRDDTSDPVLLETSDGPMRVARDRIERIDRGSGKAAEYLVLYREAVGDPDLLAELMKWCAAHQLDLHHEYLCYKILLLDPDHAAAHSEYMRLRRRDKGSVKEP